MLFHNKLSPQSGAVGMVGREYLVDLVFGVAHAWFKVLRYPLQDDLPLFPLHRYGHELSAVEEGIQDSLSVTADSCLSFGLFRLLVTDKLVHATFHQFLI